MKNLKMPANYVVVSTEEKLDMCGGGTLAQICYAFGDMFKHTEITRWQEEVRTLEEKHGAVEYREGNVYTFKDGYEATMTSGISYSYNVGDIFYGIGRLFRAFGL